MRFGLRDALAEARAAAEDRRTAMAEYVAERRTALAGARRALAEYGEDHPVPLHHVAAAGALVGAGLLVVTAAALARGSVDVPIDPFPAAAVGEATTVPAPEPTASLEAAPARVPRTVAGPTVTATSFLTRLGPTVTSTATRSIVSIHEVQLPGSTVTVTRPGTTVTHTATETVPGPTVTVPGATETVEVPGPTETVEVPGPTVTVTLPAEVVPGPTVTVTETAAAPAEPGSP